MKIKVRYINQKRKRGNKNQEKKITIMEEINGKGNTAIIKRSITGS